MAPDLSFSILIPCFNSAGYICQTIESAIGQTYPASEIIVVDDKSTDESVAIIQQLPAKLICHKINRGPANARNTALNAARSDIVVFIDSDVFIDPGLLETFLSAYAHTSPVVAGIGGCGLESNVRTIYDKWRTHHSILNYGPSDRQNVEYLFGLCASYKRDILLNIGGFDPFYNTSAGEDLDLGYKLTRAGYRLDYIAAAKVYHQHTDTAESLARNQSKYYYWSYFAKKRNRKAPWTLIAGTVRRFFADTLYDLLVTRDINLAKISILMSVTKMKSLVRAAQGKSI